MLTLLLLRYQNTGKNLVAAALCWHVVSAYVYAEVHHFCWVSRYGLLLWAVMHCLRADVRCWSMVVPVLRAADGWD